MKKIIGVAILASFFMTGVALAQTTSTASATPSLGQQIGAINKNAQDQIRVLQQELETKIKALRDEYAQKVRDVRLNAQNQIKNLQGVPTSSQARTESDNRENEKGSSTPENRGQGKFMNLLFRMFGRGK